MDPLCFNRPSKSNPPISINTIYESSNFFSTELMQPAIHSGLYFSALNLRHSLFQSSSFWQPVCSYVCLKTHPKILSPFMLPPSMTLSPPSGQAATVNIKIWCRTHRKIYRHKCSGLQCSQSWFFNSLCFLSPPNVLFSPSLSFMALSVHIWYTETCQCIVRH